MPLLQEREQIARVGILLVTGDRGLAGAFNTQIIREGLRLKREYGDGGPRSSTRSSAGAATRP